MHQKLFYRRKLPHWQPANETFFVTYRLAGSVPLNIIKEYQEHYLQLKDLPSNQHWADQKRLQEKHFHLFDDWLDKNLNQPYWLQNPDIANIVMDSLLFGHIKKYLLWASCLMGNHVHILISTNADSPPLYKILQDHKKFTALKSNRVLKRSGQFWDHESFDTIIRDNKHFFSVVTYILNNPVKAGLVKKWDDWRWTFVHPDLKNDLW